MCVSHRGRFKTPGDYIVYEMAGFRFFMILGKDRIVRSFHNVCRHRAFPVARKQSGSATVLGCRYHGWSYDTTGRLTKAPYFDDKPGFDKSQNSLFEIHTKEDSFGFLHINSGTDPKVPKSMPAEGGITGTLIKITPDVKQLSSFELEGNFNWKLLGEFISIVSRGFLMRKCSLLTDQIVNDQSRSSKTSIPASVLARFFPTRPATPTAKLDFYPLTTVHSASKSHFWYQLTYNPISPTKTSLRCDVYSVKSSGGIQFEETDKSNLEKELNQKTRGLETEHKNLTSFGCGPVTANRQF